MRLKPRHFANAGRPGVIGIDIGAVRMKAVQLVQPTGLPPMLVASLMLDRVDCGGALSRLDAQRLADGLHRRGFRGRHVVTAAPRHAMHGAWLQLPPNLSGDAMQRIATMELARTHKTEPDTLQVACWHVAHAAGNRSLGAATTPGSGGTMAVGCTHTEADALIDLLEEQALAVVGLDIEAWALARACAATEPGESDGQDIIAAVDLGHDAAAFVLLHGGTVVYERKLAGCGTRALLETIHAEHNLPTEAVDYAVFELGFEVESRGEPGDAAVFGGVRSQLDAHFASVARELNLSMQYAAHQYPDKQVSRLLLSGGGASIPSVAEPFRGLDAPAGALRLGDIVRCPDGLTDDADSTALSLAAGLALYPREAMR